MGDRLKISPPRDITGIEALSAIVCMCFIAIILLGWTLSEINNAPCPKGSSDSVCVAIKSSLEKIRIPCAIHISFACLALFFSGIMLYVMRKRAKDTIAPYTHVEQTKSSGFDDDAFE